MAERPARPGDQHPEEWREDLNPNATAGQNNALAGPSDEHNAPTAHETPELRRVLTGFTKDELKRIVVLPEGSRLEQGGTYIDLSTPDRQEFTATGDITAGRHNWFVPKSEVDYGIWNRLIGVSNPERTGQGNDQ